MKKSLKRNSGPKRKANHRMIDDIARRKNEKRKIAAMLKKATRHFSPDEDWL